MALNFQQHEPASAGRLSLIIALAVSLVCVGLYQAEGLSLIHISEPTRH